MAIVFMDSFDHYTAVLSRWSYYVGEFDFGINPSYARYGAGGLRINQRNNSRLYKNLGATYTTLVIGAAVKFLTGSTTYGGFLALSQEGTTHVDLRRDITGHLYVTRSGTTLGTAATAVLADNTWHYIEMKVYLHNSSGTVEVRVNGATVISLTGQDTNNGGSGFDQISLSSDTQAWLGSIDFDDVYVCDTSGSVSNDFLGDTRIEYLAPIGAGVRTQFTPSTGSNWSNVDEVPASDTDYNSANTPGAMDLFQMANLAGNGLVRGVQTISRAKKDDAGFRKFKPAFYKASGLGDTNRWYTGTQVAVLDSYSFLPIEVMNTSPDTGVAWTVDEVNALQYGYAVGDAGMFTIDARLV